MLRKISLLLLLEGTTIGAPPVTFYTDWTNNDPSSMKLKGEAKVDCCVNQRI